MDCSAQAIIATTIASHNYREHPETPNKNQSVKETAAKVRKGAETKSKRRGYQENSNDEGIKNDTAKANE